MEKLKEKFDLWKAEEGGDEILASQSSTNPFRHI